jgi:sterol desaturase/sphingolipid hydroxylase (fatty acid hydroxylase superfamily)
MALGHVQVLCTGLIVVAGLTMTVLERALPYKSGQALFRRGFVLDFAVYSLLQSYVVGLLVAWVVERVDNSFDASSLHLIGWLPVPLQIVFFLILHDFLLYWFHRLQHASPQLWLTHEPHHSNVEVDWVAGSRASPFEILITETMKYLPMVLLGAMPFVVVAKGTIDAIWGMYLHSNIDVRSGALQYVINGPEMHRWHHAIDVDALNKNLATKFAVWDWIFGTAWLPRDRRPCRYGLADQEVRETYWQQQANPFRAYILSRRASAMAAADRKAARTGSQFEAVGASKAEPSSEGSTP